MGKKWIAIIGSGVLAMDRDKADDEEHESGEHGRGQDRDE